MMAKQSPKDLQPHNLFTIHAQTVTTDYEDVKDRIEQGELYVVCCSNDQVVCAYTPKFIAAYEKRLG